jgi:hypothetical protein
LKEADKATGLLEVSITGLVFMVAAGFRKGYAVNIRRVCYPNSLDTVELCAYWFFVESKLLVKRHRHLFVTTSRQKARKLQPRQIPLNALG